MKVKAYQSYQESRGEWFSAVPDHWEVLPCRAIVDERNEKNDGLKSDFYLSLLANIGIIPYDEKGDIGNKKPEDLEKCKLVERGDLVINSMNYGIGSFGLSELSGVCSPVYIVLRPKSEVIEERFALRIFECRDFQTYAQSFGNGILAHRAAINWDILKALRVPVPPRPEQSLILRYLDQETGKIDALVAEQERLIALLKEKRQAVISQAVTKGLNPNAPMKDSGIEWLGQVPAHWKVVRVKSISLFITSGPRGWSERIQDAGALFIQSGDLSEDMRLNFETAKRVPVAHDAEAYRTRLINGDIVVCITGAKTGNVAICDGLNEEAFINQHLSLIRPKPLIHGRFLGFVLKGDAGRYHLEVSQYGLKQGLSLEDVAATPLALPPINEQEAILAHLTSAMRQSDTLITEATQAITLLRERRAALISAAVTGKIDVRALAPSQPEAA